MTRQPTFKKKIRARMEKTGERYAAARLALLGAAHPSSAFSLPNNYDRTSSVHSPSARLCSLLGSAGVVDPSTNQPFTEAGLFVLMGGVGFMYFVFEYVDAGPLLTFVCRSWSIPWPLVERALQHLQIPYEVLETGSTKRAAASLRSVLELERSAQLTVDGAELPWRGVAPQWRGQQPRQVNVFGSPSGDVLLDDGGIHLVSEKTLGAARASVKKAKHRMLTILDGAQPVRTASQAAKHALAETARSFRTSPKKGFESNFGLRGLEKAAERMGDKKNKRAWPNLFRTGPLAHRALVRTWECATLEYTPPAGGRPFYAQGLSEFGFDEAAARAMESGALFEQLADDALALGDESVRASIGLSEEIDALANGDSDQGGRIHQLRAERRALEESCALNDVQRRDAFAALSERMLQIVEAERNLVDAIEHGAGVSNKE